MCYYNACNLIHERDYNNLSSQNKSTNNLSSRTILHLSFSDVLFALFGVPAFIFGSINKTNSRVLEFASPCFIVLFSHVSLYILGLTGVDRFVRINYYIKYQEILSPFRVFVVQIF